MTKQKRNEPSQRTLFRKAARKLGADESESNFDTALKKVARHKPMTGPISTDDQENPIESGKKNIQRD